MPYFNWTGILYPVDILAIYHLVHSGYLALRFESQCDEAIQNFLRHQDTIYYRDLFQKSMDENTKGLIILRALTATYSLLPSTVSITVHGVTQTTEKTAQTNKFDHLPKHLRDEICSFLGLRRSISHGEVAKMLEAASRQSTIEQQILGRMGYLFIWRHLNELGGTNIESAALLALSAPK